MAKRSMFVGMDVHKESIDVSIAEEGRDGEVRRYGVIPGDLEAVAKVVRAFAPRTVGCGSCMRPAGNATGTRHARGHARLPRAPGGPPTRLGQHAESGVFGDPVPVPRGAGRRRRKPVAGRPSETR